MTSYQSIAAIDAYAATKLNTNAWDAASTQEKTKASFEATRIIDQFRYINSKLSEDQEHEFPRSDQSSVPADVLYAHAEIAIALLSGSVETYSQGVISERFAAVGVTYDAKNVPMWQRVGIYSERAWYYLLPYLAVTDTIRIHRAS